MVNAEDDRAAPAKILDDVISPQRMGGIERLAQEPADERLQLARPGPARQPGRDDVVRKIECRIGLPVGRPVRVHRPLAEARVAQEMPADRRGDPRVVDAVAQRHDRADHHQVVRPVHPQPRGVHGGHPVASSGRHQWAGR
jgi:hypothetical protein